MCRGSHRARKKRPTPSQGSWGVRGWRRTEPKHETSHPCMEENRRKPSTQTGLTSGFIKFNSIYFSSCTTTSVLLSIPCLYVISTNHSELQHSQHKASVPSTSATSSQPSLKTDTCETKHTMILPNFPAPRVRPFGNLWCQNSKRAESQERIPFHQTILVRLSRTRREDTEKSSGNSTRAQTANCIQSACHKWFWGHISQPR